MKSGTLQKVVLATVLVFLLVVPAGQAGANDPLIAKAAALKGNLEANGFQVLGDVNYSRFLKVDPVQMHCDGEIDSCNANNNAPYHVAAVPKLPGQADPFSDLQFRIRRNEAVVLVGNTPPPCDYFSYVCFQYYRYEQGWGPDNVHKVFSALGDPLNRFVLNTGGRDFDKNIVLVFTSDQNTRRAVKRAAISAGFPEDVFNTFVIPSGLLKTNDALDETADQLLILHRTALWRDGSSDGAGYLDNPHVVVFRVTPPHTSHTPLPAPKQRVRGTGRTELDYGPAVDQLREAILNRYSDLSAQELTTHQWLVESPIALQTLTNTLGDSRDTVYLRTQESFKLSDSPDDFLIVYGVNHRMSKKATYHSATVYTEFKECGVVSATDHCNQNPSCVPFAGSAWEYLHDQLEASPLLSERLYALKIARNCNGERYCLQVPTGSCPKAVGLDEGLFVGFRAYVEPDTNIGPAYTELLFDRVIHFTSSPPSLLLASKAFESVYPEPATVSFGVTSTTPGDVSWEAKIEHVDDIGCGIIDPAQGVIPGGNGEASFQFQGAYPGAYYLTLTIKDQQGRFSRTEVKVVTNP